MTDFGDRIRQLREVRRIGTTETGLSRSGLSKAENGIYSVTFEVVERLCMVFDVGFKRFFSADQEFEDMLVLEDPLVQEVLPFLKQLSEEQKKQILKTLEAAPKQGKGKHQGRPRSAPSWKRI